jgi:hypothetical protein
VIGVVLIEQAALLRLWTPLLEGTGASLHIDPYVYYPVVYGVLLAAFMAAPLLGLALAGLLARLLSGNADRTGVLETFTAFGYAMIPLALASHVAYGLYQLLTRSRAAPFAFLAMMGWFPGGARAAWLPNSAVFTIEMAVLVLGAVGSLYVGYRLYRRKTRHAFWAACLSYGLVLLALLAANLYAVSTLLREMR